jgi:hypothetical protein
LNSKPLLLKRITLYVRVATRFLHNIHHLSLGHNMTKQLAKTISEKIANVVIVKAISNDCSRFLLFFCQLLSD